MDLPANADRLAENPVVPGTSNRQKRKKCLDCEEIGFPAAKALEVEEKGVPDGGGEEAEAYHCLVQNHVSFGDDTYREIVRSPHTDSSRYWEITSNVISFIRLEWDNLSNVKSVGEAYLFHPNWWTPRKEMGECQEELHSACHGLPEVGTRWEFWEIRTYLFWLFEMNIWAHTSGASSLEEVGGSKEPHRHQ